MKYKFIRFSPWLLKTPVTNPLPTPNPAAQSPKPWRSWDLAGRVQWVVVKIRVPFWVPEIIGAVL